MVADIGFSKLGINELVALSIPENYPSKRIIEKIGGLYERDVMYKGSMCNLYRLTPKCIKTM
jgi:RimJ/RimL family protein N-acetyltransferase